MIIGTNYRTAIGLFGTLIIMLIGLFSTYPAIRAYESGKNFAKWYIFSFLLFPVALIASFFLQDVRNKSNQEKPETGSQ